MPSTIYLVTGGCRSGKSSYAQSLCESICPNPIYLATSGTSYSNPDFEDRVRRHQQDRGDRWTTIEEELNLSQHSQKFKNKAVLVDCTTLWLTNLFLKHGVFKVGESDGQSSEQRRQLAEAAFHDLKDEFEKLTNPWGATYVIVTNEVGSGTHASEAVSRLFTDYQGWVNQYVAHKADQVIHMVSGYPHILKNFALEEPRKAIRTLPISDSQRMEAIRLDKFLSTRSTPMDGKGYFMMCLEDARIKATFHSCMVNENGEVCDLDGNKISCCNGSKGPEPMKTWKCRTAKELTVSIFEEWESSHIVSAAHAAYIGREAQRAEYCLYSGQHYQQD